MRYRMVAGREVAKESRRGRPWGLPFEARILLGTAYWRTKWSMRQLAPLLGVSESAADRTIDHLGPEIALQPRERFRRHTVLIVDGSRVPTHDRSIAEHSKDYRYSTAHQVVIYAGSRPIVMVGRPLPGRRHARGREGSSAKDAAGRTMTTGDGGCRGHHP